VLAFISSFAALNVGYLLVPITDIATDWRAFRWHGEGWPFEPWLTLLVWSALLAIAVGLQVALTRWIRPRLLVAVSVGVLLIGLSMTLALVNVEHLQSPDAVRRVTNVFIIIWAVLPFMAALVEAAAVKDIPTLGTARD
jgi:hypothetical protein